MTIWFASNNAHKKEELSAILGKEIKVPSDVGLNFDPEETGSSFLENALLKAEALRLLLEEKKPFPFSAGDVIIADDSGLCVDALDGKPGIYSARYGSTDGKKLNDKERNALLLDELGNNVLRTARFVCAMVLVFCKDRFFAVQETLEGEIIGSIKDSKGTGGFGYDPVFFLPDLKLTVAELPQEEKNRISHRAKAGKAIKIFLAV